MKTKLQNMITGLKEAFRPLPTFEDLQTNFPHKENCSRESRLRTIESQEMIMSGVMSNSFAVTRRSLVCPDCKNSQLFR